jgi:hypothetical protein
MSASRVGYEEKNTFNTQKLCLKKKIPIWVKKKIESAFKG